MSKEDLLSKPPRVLNGIKAITEGRGVLLVDDESRENEGDLIFLHKNERKGHGIDDTAL